MDKTPETPDDPWQPIRRFTNARIGLQRHGDSVPTDALLRFQHDHAEARDAVHAVLDTTLISDQLGVLDYEWIIVRSAAEYRDEYLKRPDLGRRVDDLSRTLLQACADVDGSTFDAVFVIADGLSSRAVERHAVFTLQRATTLLTQRGWRIAPIVIAEQGRVAIGDEIGELLRAEQVVVLIGERPGLSVAESLGAYLTYAPRPGRNDAERNCISNIHAAGLSYAQAADALVYLMTEASIRKLTGVELKDERQGPRPRLDG